MKKLVFVCLGNICRSPMAEFVMKSMTDNYEIQSRATSSWEHGNPIHKGTQGIFQEYEIPYDKGKTSLQISKEDFEAFDYIIGMDAWNIRNIMRIIGSDPEKKVSMLLDFTDRPGTEIADPWYTGNFDATYDDVLEGCTGLLEHLKNIRWEMTPPL